MGNGDHLVVDYLKRMRAQNPTFFYSIESTTDNYKNMFWVDPSFRMNYNYFGDTVRLDIAPHHYTLPLVSITGINHHGQPVLFGCGLLHHHSFASYIWLLQNWLHAMSGNYPVSITTQPDHHIQMAVAQLLPQTRHRFCKSTIFRQTHEKLSQTQSFHNEFRNCIHETETVHEFESCWQALLRRYSLMDNEWLHSIYNARHQWVPAYMKQTFFGQLLLPEEEEEENDMLFFFNGYVNSTTSIQSLVKQYESAVTSWQEMEVKADFETATTMPVLKTPSPMEKQAANLYTRRAFIKFQEELVETLANQATKLEEEEDSSTTYRVAKFGDEEQQEKKKAVHIVRLNTFEMKAICSCHMFEFSGIICRHALSVFRAQNVLTLPSQYILKRWTRDAKRGATGGGEYVTEQLLLTSSSSSNSQDSLTVRYNNLRHEALKFVEEGAKSIHIYNAAVDALQVAANKVAASKKRVNDHQGVLLNGENQETNLDKGSQQKPYQSKVEKEKKINELSSELENINQRCEVYRANLLAVLRDMEEHKLKLSVKVQNARLSLKE